MFNKILIANRGEIACRIIRTAKQLGITCVTIYSEVDSHAQHVKLSNEAYCINGKTSTESYLNHQKILTVAKEARVEAIHPGYGFLSENPEFAAECIKQNIAFIGPPVEAIIAMGSKRGAKILAQNLGIPVIPGYHGNDQQLEFLTEKANEIGYPVLIKAVEGGGGKGMRVVLKAEDFEQALTSAKREALSAFGSDEVLLEKYLSSPRHIEVQIFADTQGNVVHLFERDCSIQRRHQKIIEESPAINFTKKLRNEMTACAIKIAQAVDYVGAGTIEFLLDRNKFYFMEMNTRLQVEHPITEKITNIDLVEWQLRIASGEPLPLLQSQISFHGHAIEARIYAEDPNKHFLPSIGAIYFLKTPEENLHIRLDSGVTTGDDVTPYYDPMLGKLIAWGDTREDALRYLQKGLIDYQLVGVTTNRDFLQKILKEENFINGKFDTNFVKTHLNHLLTKTKLSPLAVIALTMYVLLTQKKSTQLDALKTNDPYSPWVLGDAWRLNSVPEQTLCFCYFDDVINVKVINVDNNFHIALDEKKYSGSATLVEHGVIVYLSVGEYSVNVVEYEDNYHLFLEHETAIIKPYIPKLASSTQDGRQHLTAPLPGTLIAILAKEGDSVKEGTSLAVIEAMKMEHTIRAPNDGVVKHWYFQVGDLVSEGEELLVFEG